MEYINTTTMPSINLTVFVEFVFIIKVKIKSEFIDDQS